MICESVPFVRYNINRSNPVVMSEMPPIRHGVVSVHVKLAAAGCRGFCKHVEIVRSVGSGFEPDTDRRPALGVGISDS